jgi:hypothetical protein
VNPDGRIERAGLLYERAVFGGEAGVLETAGRELDAVEADLSLARGRIVHALFLEERVEETSELALFERAMHLTGSWATCAARLRRCSGSASIIRS